MAVEIVDSGKCGSELAWTFDAQGVLTIIGSGKMDDYSLTSSLPWKTYNDSITSIVISKNVSEIHENAFKNCTALLEITVEEGNGVYHSADNCLIETKSKTLIKGAANSVIPTDGTVTEIAAYAFYNCSGLTSINIPNTITYIGKYAFHYCPNLESISVGKLNSKFHSYNNCLISTPTKELVLGCKNSIIPNDGTVSEIDDSAFANARDLKMVTIPDTITKISVNAFSGCSGMTEIIIPSSVVEIGGSAFRGCTGLREITVPQNVTKCESSAFTNCTGLEKVTIFCNSVENGVFRGCTGIKNLYLGSGVNKISATAFKDCVNLENIEVDDNNTSFVVRGNCLIQKAYFKLSETSNNYYNGIIIGCNNSVIPNSVAGVAAYAFYGRTEFTDIDAIDDLLYVEEYAFYGCTGLVGTLDLDSSGIYGVGAYAFYGCSGLTGVIIGDNIGKEALYACPNIKNIIVTDSYDSTYSPSSVIDLTSVESISVSKGNKYYHSEGNCLLGNFGSGIGSQKYSIILGCKNSIIPTEGVWYIRGNAFKGCVELTSIAIPSNITNIVSSAFSGCESLTDIYFGGTEEQWKSAVDENAEFNDAVIHYNAPETMQTGGCGDGVNWTLTTNCVLTISGNGKMDDFSAWSAVPWSEERLGIEKVVIDEGVTSISDFAFYGCQSLVSVAIPMSVKRIGDVAFYDCPKLLDVYYGGNELHWNLIEIGEENDLLSSVNVDFALPEIPEHVLGKWEVVKEAGCTEKGKEERACQYCSYIESRETVAAGHLYEKVITKPTCEEKGYTTYICSACEDKYIDNEVEAKGHMYEVVVTEATCEDAGYTTHICKACKNSYIDSEIEALGHELGEWTTKKEAGCTEDGEAKRSCTRCTYFETKEIEATGHAYKTVVTEPACETKGYATHTCGVCRASYVDNEVKALGHNLGGWTIMKEAGCTEDGEAKRSCTRCTYFETKEIEATGHAYKTVVTEPACETKGYATHTCGVCRASYVDNEVKALGHNLGGWTITKEAGCSEAGEAKRSCTRCTYFETRVIEATGHAYEAVVTEPTCEEGGYITRTCGACGASYVDNEVETLGHSFTNYISDNNATTESAGTLTATCDRCDATDTIPDPAGPVIPDEPDRPSEPDEPVEEVVRIAGDGRIDTGLAVAGTLKEVLDVEKFDAVILATSKTFADALPGSYLAYVKKAPILLVSDGRMDDVTKYVKANLAVGGKIYILGGTSAVSAAVEDNFIGYDVERLQVEGKGRYFTNLEILKEAEIRGGEMIVATGQDFADSLSASAVKLPILMVRDTLSEAQKEFLAVAGIEKFYIVGGKGAVSAALEDELQVYAETERVAGNIRRETSIEVAKKFFDAPTQIVVASASDFPDGLCGGPLAAALNAPLVLTVNGKTSEAAGYTSANGIESGFVLGGTSALTNDAVISVFRLSGEDENVVK